MTLSKLLPCLGLLAGFATAQQFDIDQPVGADTFGGRSVGQTITPNVGVVPDPGSPGTLSLTRVTLYRGNGTAAIPSATTWLLVFFGDPNAGGVLLGSSSNTVDTTTGSFHTPMVWDFAQVPMIYTSEHWLVMSSTQASLTPVECPLETAPRAGANVYTGGAGLIANGAQHPQSVDARFHVEFYQGFLPSYATFGVGCGSSAGVATNTASTLPQVGATWTIDIGTLPSPEVVLLLIGTSNTLSAFGPLPIDLGLIGAPGCSARVSDDALQLFGIGAGGTTTFPIAIPAAPLFAGLPLFTQGLVFEAGVNPLGIVTSDAAAATIGS